jgi:hypothetical protein
MRTLRPSPSMAVAFIALLVALGGTSYAVVRLPANSVGAKQLKRNAVTAAKLKNGAVTRAKIRANAITGAQILESSLDPVASSAHAASAAALDKVTYRGARVSVPAAPDPTTPAVAVGTATCDTGLVAVGGGVKVDDADNTAVVDSYPAAGGRAWSATVDNGDATAAHDFSVFAVCVPAATVG